MPMLARFITQHNKLMIGLFVLLSLMLGFFVQNFRIDASAETLLLKNNKLYIESQLINQRFAPQEFILVAYEPKEGDVFSEQSFQAITQLSEAFSQLDRVEAVTHILNVPLLSQVESLDAKLNPDDWTWQAKQFSPENMRQIFNEHPLYTDLLVNQAMSATAIQIVFKKDERLSTIYQDITQLQKKVLSDELSEDDQRKIDELRQEADPLEQKLNKQRQQEIADIYKITEPFEKQATIYLGGAQVLAFQLIDIIQSDLVVFGSAIALMICLLLFVIFQQLRWVFIPIICCAISVVLTIGLFGLLDLRTTVISSNFVALQLILTLAIVIHLLVEYRQQAEQQPKASQQELVQQTFINKLSPCFYAGLTTCVGFGSLLFSGIQPVVSFGWMMIVAMIISILVSLILFPAMVSLLKRQDKTQYHRLSQWIINGLQQISMGHRTLIMFISLGLLIGSAIGLSKLSVENSFINYFDKSTRVFKELSFIDQQFGGSTQLDVIYTIPQQQQKKDLVLSAETVQSLQKVQFVMKQFEAMGNVTSIVNFTELAQIINQGKPLTEYELTVIYRLIDKSLTEQLLGSYFSVQTQQLRISSRIKDTTANLNRAEFIETLKQDIEGVSVVPHSFVLGNLFVLYQDILQRLFSSQILTMGIVYSALFVVLLGIFRSFKIALIAIIPNILSTMLILGIMGWFNIPLDLMTITIVAIAMGIAVDDTIHFVHRFTKELRSKSADDAVEATYGSIGFALLYTSFIITLGFSLLSFSDFVPSVMFGLLTGLAMMVALLTDLTLLPAMLSRFCKGAEQK
ncbi:MAG: efflux RND transporter permease subunit [Paraglaciecola sp.]|uniref:efflux RND transporter permease subunit n=1 Tax=Paraglaciecola sp. TaxID=1920173 RepID=UPI00273F4715|nr:efflux RND transporter permease subunit [Paraglaciecola sp.]MDP5032577.1 efflux RND transporter permease subunit [Paraglaciecola sp.]MDP5040479.1 efflux RND transporter permease subunit [Paraglaciecola sp.]MDP5129497.1 efflux RND transporter permease subunit [Paraglaciecola sp.]